MKQNMNKEIVLMSSMTAKLIGTLLLLVLAGGKAAAQEGGGSGEGSGESSGSSTPPTTTGVHINGSVYGGGNLADVGGNVEVNMLAGIVEKDVYGGGALADTNKWDLNGGYTEVTGLVVGESVVTGLFERSASEPYTYTEITTQNQKAVSGKTYCKKGVWATGNSPTTYTTTVNLYGGTIMGDAYGGGLGRVSVAAKAAVTYTQAQADEYNAEHNLTEEDDGYVTTETVLTPAVAAVEEVEAKVYGDVTLNLGKEDASSATKFNISPYGGDHSDVVKSGRVFGCNNLKGCPLGDVKVTVYRTVAGNVTRTAEDPQNQGFANKSTNVPHTYEVAAVYGGGNLADYSTVAGKKAYVRIETCDVSIQSVYGGGNAAAVPGTDVLVRGAWEIQEVFGGGNGKDPYTTDNGANWTDNPGANVNGNANTLLTGGYIHEAYGGSNEKGTINGSVAIDMGIGTAAEHTDGACTLSVEKLVGAGKNADVNGDLIMILGCKPETKTPLLFAGADNANVNGDVELTITSGRFGKVFGGNNDGGIIMGHIKVNIEETGECDVPIEIDELYLGGNNAMYSAYGYYKDGGAFVARTAEMAAVSPEAEGYISPLTATDFGTAIRKTVPYAQPELNVIACTRIGRVYGGGYGSGATLYGNPVVNINMIPGSKASEIKRSGTANANDLGAIGGQYTNADGEDADGGIFGGGDGAEVHGNTTVNIGTAETVYMNTEPLHLGTEGTDYNERTIGGKTVYEVPVQGAYITGNVYGGGNQAGVTGNTQVNICEKKVTVGESQVWQNVTPGTGGVTINGDVFGAGKGLATDVTSALVAGNSIIKMGGGSVKKSVYGGGQLSQVGSNTDVTVCGGTIGTANLGSATYGNIYGGGFGSLDDVRFGLIKGNTSVTIENASETVKPTIIHNVYGGGAYGSVGDFNYDDGNMVSGRKTANTGKAEVYVAGGTIGTTGKNNGMVFGSSRGDVGDENSIHNKLAWVYDTHVVIGDTTENATITTTTPLIKGSVYGGGENGHNFHDAYVRINGGTIGIHDTDNDVVYKDNPDDPDEETYKGKDYNYPYRGNVYGGGCGTDKYYSDPDEEKNDGNGDTYNSLAGIVRGNANVNITAGTIVHNVYGAGAMGSVGNMTKNATTNAITFTSGGTTTIDVRGGTVGVDGSDGGNIFGAARGDASTTQTDIALVKSTNVSISGTGTEIWGSVYGGGQVGDVGTYTTANGTNTYPSGYGTCTVSVSGGTIHHNVFGAGKGDANTFECMKAMVSSTSVTVSNGTVNGNVYGGGEVGRVENNTVVSVGREYPAAEGTDYYELTDGDELAYSQATVETGQSVAGLYTRSGEEGSYVYTPVGTSTPHILGSVFGAGAGLATHGYSALVRGNANVTVEGGATVGHSVYGGGETASVGRYGLNAENMPNILLGGGYCYVNVRGAAVIGPANASDEEGNVFGACKGVDPETFNNSGSDDTKKSRRMTVYNATDFKSDFTTTNNTTWKYVKTYTNEELNDNTITKYVWEYYPTKAAYKTYLETLALATHPEVTIAGSATVNGSVFGGGELGLTKGSVIVTINGGTVQKDVYGGGALANTNTTSSVGVIVNGVPQKNTDGSYQTTTVHPTTTVNLTGGLINGDAYGGGLGQKDGFNDKSGDIPAVVYGDIHLNLGSSTSGSSATAFKTSYYTGDHAGVVKSGRVFGCNNLMGSPQGNVTVTVYKTVTGKDGSNNNLSRTTEEAKAGNKTIKENNPENYESVNGYVTPTYEVAAVYGGGNLADYTATGKKANVVIETCEVSVKSVYGGGNAAEVPGTDVLVKGAWEIQEVFGGGNGKDPYTNGSTWIVNPGANIGNSTTPGDANTLLTGGLIHEAYGGSNEKGTIYGNVKIDLGTGGTCTLDVEKMVGAGKNADVNGNLIMILGCKPSEKVPVLYAGADQANVNGNVELTITSGNYGKVFGGNNLSGAIRGHIKLNIEETGDCQTPITIDKLYLGGNEAAYSRYGYYVETSKTGGTPVGDIDENAVLTAAGKLHFIPRESASDPHLPVESYSYDETNGWSWTVKPISGTGAFTPYAQPELNIISCTRIDEVFGGGYGETAIMYCDPVVNINMIQGSKYSGVPTVMTSLNLPSTDNPNQLGIIGDVYGGGDAAAVYGNTTVNIGTADKVLVKSWTYDPETEDYTAAERNVVGAYIRGNVFGGGKLADVGKTHLVTTTDQTTGSTTTTDVIDINGNTHVNIGAKYNSTKWESVDGLAVTIKGNVYGGGQGEALPNGAGAFRCGKAMITESTSVTIGNGTVEQTVYGGGKVGRVEQNTTVTIGVKLAEGVTTSTSVPVIKGYVFGAGAGVNTHGYSALVRGISTVTVQGGAQVKKSVYGGGEIASVGRYAIADDAYHRTHPAVEIGLPYSLADPNNVESGMCIVNVWDQAVIGPDEPMLMTKDGGPDDLGHVFGAGKGVLPYEGYAAETKAWRMAPPDNTHSVDWKEEYLSLKEATDDNKDEDDYLKFIESMALATETYVTVGGDAFVKGSVYGGSENGHVQFSTHVTIEDNCQIGCGKNTTNRHPSRVWESNYKPSEGDDNSLECASWTYDPSSAAPYDKFATKLSSGKYYYENGEYAEGGCYIAKDGHSYYGNVFGGGSGVIPYRPGKWHREAGSVGRNTTVNITGGHILTSVYGGNEQTDVGAYILDSKGQPTIPAHDGKCTVNMVGGTLGVPRTVSQMTNHPVACNLFGAGKGDQRIFFNTWTNVIETEVNISGNARIYGSTFGGGEDGHIIGNSVTNIGGSVTIDGINTPFTENGLIIGTTGTSYVDGNVFGGGRGFSGDAQTAGTVGGNIQVDISGGTMLGSVYGGGRLASVGTQFTAPDDPNYGNFIEDVSAQAATYYEEGDDIPEGKHVGDVKSEAVAAKSYGHVSISISGGTIGNDAEVPYASTVTTTGKTAEEIKAARDAEIAELKVAHGLPNTVFEYESENNRYVVSHSTGGNVFGGSMGRLTLLNGSINDIWPKMAQVKTTQVTISGDASIKRNVYGGGELGTVRDDAAVTISGGTVRRDVYGGGYGSADFETETTIHVKEPKEGVTNPSSSNDYDTNVYKFTPMIFAGCVGKSTTVNVNGGWVRKSVYGGGEMASVGIINCRVDANGEYLHFHKHDDETNGFVLSWPYHFEYVDGFDGATHVNVTGGRIGVKEVSSENNDDIGTDNGDVYGAGKGIAGDYKDYVFCANVGSADVNINITSDEKTLDPTTYQKSGDCITGAVYGGGENGHVMGDAKLTLKSGLIGHSIYGGGSGKGKFTKWLEMIPADRRTVVTSGGTGTAPHTNTSDEYEADCYSITAGKVFGNTEIDMIGGYVVRNVYGGGNMGSVGKGNYAGGADDYSTVGYGETLSGNLWDGESQFSKAFLNSGKCTVKITGGTVGYIGSDGEDPLKYVYPRDYNTGLPYGNVFGGCRGESAPNILEHPRYLYCPEFFLGYVNETDVQIGKTDGSGPVILGSVYGGGMDGHVRRDTKVTINGGEIGSEYTTMECTKVGTSDLNHIMWLHRGNVYGAGSGIGKYKYDFNYDGDYGDKIKYTTPPTSGGRESTLMEEDYSSSAGSVTRFTEVEIKGGKIHRNVYGGGSLSSVGAPKIPPITADPIRRDDNATTTKGRQTLNEVIVSGGHIGDDSSYDATTGKHVYGGMVYGGSRGMTELDNSFSTALYTAVDVSGNADVKGDVYGGGEAGSVKGDVDVNIAGGTIGHDVYGGGALADTQINNWDATNNNWADGKYTASFATVYNTDVALKGGTISGNVYGGGLGRMAEGTQGQAGYDPGVEAKVYGDVLVTLNGTKTATTTGTGDQATTTYQYNDNCVVKGSIFGCNNLNGSPQSAVTVHVYKTQGWTDDKGTVNTSDDVSHFRSAQKNGSTFELTAVYGGGNLAAYYPGLKSVRDMAQTHVIIDGCELTSIKQVYGGGNAASTPATSVTINGSYEIDEVFGGGNGLDRISKDGGTTYIKNPGANVGFKDYCDYTDGEVMADLADYDTKEERTTNPTFLSDYVYGSGKASVNIFGGTIHRVFGGSNTRGNVRETAVTLLQDMDGCEFLVEEAYGGGKSAPMDAEAKLLMACIPGLKAAYGGAEAADIQGGVSLRITNGKFERVFGGNNKSGHIRGPIVVDIEETGCKPIIIGELYGGGNLAGYSVYGYNTDGTPKEPASATETPLYDSPKLNVKSFTSIGEIFGGGYGASAVMVGDPTVNVSVAEGEWKNYAGDDTRYDEEGYVYDATGYKGETITIVDGKDASGNPTQHSVAVPSHSKGKIGAVNNIFGGGNAANVVGNTYVNIGTDSYVYMAKTVAANYVFTDSDEYYTRTGTGTSVDPYVYTKATGTANGSTTYYLKLPVKGADIRGNVYGGGNAADVTGKTNVVIGKESE